MNIYLLIIDIRRKHYRINLLKYKQLILGNDFKDKLFVSHMYSKRRFETSELRSE